MTLVSCSQGPRLTMMSLYAHVAWSVGAPASMIFGRGQHRVAGRKRCDELLPSVPRCQQAAPTRPSHEGPSRARKARCGHRRATPGHVPTHEQGDCGEDRAHSSAVAYCKKVRGYPTLDRSAAYDFDPGAGGRPYHVAHGAHAFALRVAECARVGLAPSVAAAGELRCGAVSDLLR